MKSLVTALVRSMTFMGWEGAKPVLIYSKPHTFSTFIGKEKESVRHLLSLPRPLGIKTK